MLQYHVRPDGSLVPLTPFSIRLPDPTLPSQGERGGDPSICAITPSPDGSSVYVADGDSQTTSGVLNGQIVQYRVGKDGALSPTPVSRLDSLQTPVSMALSPDGRLAFVLQRAYNVYRDHESLALYRVGPGGRLALAPNQPYNVPRPVSVFDAADEILFSPDGRRLFVSDAAGVHCYTVGRDGALTPYPSEADAGPHAGMVYDGQANSMSVSPDGRWLVVTAFGGEDGPQVACIRVSREAGQEKAASGARVYYSMTDGSLSPVSLPKEKGSQWAYLARMLFSPDGRWLYTDGGDNASALFVYRFAPATGELTRAFAYPQAVYTTGKALLSYKP